MALMYPWATKEYLLWEMTIGQIILYHNKGIQIKNGTPDKVPGLTDKSVEELRTMKDEMREVIDQENLRVKLAAKYGDI